MSRAKIITDFLASAKLLHFTMPVLIIYLVIGTVAQKYIGLYESTKIFFSGAIFWLGPVPLPGLPIFMALIFLNLLFKIIFKSPWVWRKSGIIVTHIGAMLLLLGGLFTALFSTEGYVDLAQGQSTSIASDYHIRELALLGPDNQEIATIPFKELAENTRHTLPHNITIEILQSCRNCKITAREDADERFISMAKHMSLKPQKPEHLDEENLTGITFNVRTEETDQIFVALENVPKLPEITIGDEAYRFILRKHQRDLPFTVELLEFNRSMHPGTAMAKDYSSRVRIIDNGAQWESLISMNEPLRYKGYTLFQSSFITRPEGDISVLSAVWNAGRAFPYISGIVMCLGLILHCFVRKPKEVKNA